MTIRFEDTGRPHDEVLQTTRADDADWRNGRVPLYVFSGRGLWRLEPSATCP